MTPVAVGLNQLKALIHTLLDKKRLGPFAVQCRGEWSGVRAVTVLGRAFQLAKVDSSLAARELLSLHGRNLVLVTELDERALGMDLQARLDPPALVPLRPWDMLRDLLALNRIDPRLSGHGWIAETLIHHHQEVGPRPGGYLDHDTAWSHLLRIYLKLDVSPAGASSGWGEFQGLDAVALLRWSCHSDNHHRLEAAPEPFRRNLPAYLKGRLGELAGLFYLVLSQAPKDLVPLGLVCRSLYPEKEGEADARALLKVAYLGRASLSGDAALKWAEAAEAVLAQMGNVSRARFCTERAQEILGDLQVGGDVVSRGDWLPAGLERRISRFAEALQKKATLAEARTRLNEVLVHRALNPGRAEQMRFAFRLAQWLAWRTKRPVSGDFRLAVRSYVDEGAYLDLAGDQLWHGDTNPDFNAVSRQLLTKLEKEREGFNRAFAESAAQVVGGLEGDDMILPIEGVLDRMVVPLAKAGPILLLVMDGMSLAVFYELSPELEAEGWIELTPSTGQMPAVVGAVPTRTEVCRASLLAGGLVRGGKQVERQRFSNHAGLCKAANQAPELFHKDSLMQGGGGLAEPVRSVLADPAKRVVALVVNGVDDFVVGRGQIAMRWTPERMPALKQILDMARTAGRTLILASGHGHVPARDGICVPADTPWERCRPRGGQPTGPEEVELSGTRVLDGDGTIIALWSGKLRYASAKKGVYHGGVSPRELVAPLSVFKPLGADDPDGWREAGLMTPDWWSLEAVSPLVVAKAPQKKAADSQAGLFDQSGNWVERLFENANFKDQVERVRDADLVRLRKFLALADRHHYRLTRALVQKELKIPNLRFVHNFSKWKALLNLDAVPILKLGGRGGVIELNRALLDEQFEL